MTGITERKGEDIRTAINIAADGDILLVVGRAQLTYQIVVGDGEQTLNSGGERGPSYVLSSATLLGRGQINYSARFSFAVAVVPRH